MPGRRGLILRHVLVATLQQPERPQRQREAYHSFKHGWYDTYSGEQPAMLIALPSYDAIRLVDKLPLLERMRRRVSGSAAKAFEVYQ